MAEWDLLLRLAVALALGGAIGFEREMDEQPAGFRTHMLVSLGAALFTVVGAYGVENIFDDNIDVRLDPTRVAAQIVTGIGFLGAGAIIQEGISVRGLTTAASLWVTAAIGMAVGFGAWIAAIGATALAMIALFVMKRVGYRLIPRAARNQTRVLVKADERMSVAGLVAVVEQAGLQIDGVKVAAPHGGEREVFLRLRDVTETGIRRIVSDISDHEGVRGVDWQH